MGCFHGTSQFFLIWFKCSQVQFLAGPQFVVLLTCLRHLPLSFAER
jgi:hypothetical protein